MATGFRTSVCVLVLVFVLIFAFAWQAFVPAQADEKMGQKTGAMAKEGQAALPESRAKKVRQEIEAIEKNSDAASGVEKAALEHVLPEHSKIAEFEKMIQTLAAALGRNNPAIINAQLALAMQYYFCGQVVDAIPIFEGALQAGRSAEGVQNDTKVTSAVLLGQAYLKQKQWAKAEALFQEYIPLCEKLCANDQKFKSYLGACYLGLARASCHQEKLSQAEGNLEKARSLAGGGEPKDKQTPEPPAKTDQRQL